MSNTGSGTGGNGSGDRELGDRIVFWVNKTFDQVWIRGPEGARFLLYAVLTSVAGGVSVAVWLTAWEKRPSGLPRQITEGLTTLFPAVDFTAVLVAALVGFVGALVTVFPLDTYKRREGWYVFAGLVSVVVTLVARIGTDGIVAAAPFALPGGILGYYLGLRAAEVGEEYTTGGATKFETGFERLRYLATGLALAGTADAVFVYRGPVSLTADGASCCGVTSLSLAPGWTRLAVAGLAASVGLYYLLDRVTTYDEYTDLFVLGPERSGKTYFIAGIAYSLVSREGRKPHASPVEMNNELRRTDSSTGERGLYDKFKAGDFDEIGTTDPGEVHVYEIVMPSGWLFGNPLRFRVLDYPGEYNLDVDPDPEAINFYDFNITDPEELSRKEKLNSILQYVNAGLDLEADEETAADEERAQTRSDGVPASDGGGQRDFDYEELTDVISAFAALSDTVLCVLPIDDYVDDLTYPDDFPEYVDEESDLNKQRIPKEDYESKYASVVEKLDDRDVQVLVTMTDLLTETFGANPREHPAAFRDHVVDRIIKNDPVMDLATHFDYSHFNPDSTEVSSLGRVSAVVGRPPPFIPVYLEPDQEHDDGETRPNLDAQYSSHLLWGLEYLLGRIR
ncbi:MAG: hypothetical protein V5A55_10425 [Halovenus sp.]